MNHHYILFGIVITLLLYLLNKHQSSKKINMNLYNPFIITNNQTRKITEILNNKMEKNIDDKKWISDDIMIKKCYNLCQGNMGNNYIKCIDNCKMYDLFTI